MLDDGHVASGRTLSLVAPAALVSVAARSHVAPSALPAP
jgi:hypothetical protein